jgi:hypothetical protein
MSKTHIGPTGAANDGGLLPQVFEASGRFGGRTHTNRSGWFGEQTAE